MQCHDFQNFQKQMKSHNFKIKKFLHSKVNKHTIIVPGIGPLIPTNVVSNPLSQRTQGVNAQLPYYHIHLFVKSLIFTYFQIRIFKT